MTLAKCSLLHHNDIVFLHLPTDNQGTFYVGPSLEVTREVIHPEGFEDRSHFFQLGNTHYDIYKKPSLTADQDKRVALRLRALNWEGEIMPPEAGLPLAVGSKLLLETMQPVAQHQRRALGVRAFEGFVSYASNFVDVAFVNPAEYPFAVIWEVAGNEANLLQGTPLVAGVPYKIQLAGDSLELGYGATGGASSLYASNSFAHDDPGKSSVRWVFEKAELTKTAFLH